MRVAMIALITFCAAAACSRSELAGQEGVIVAVDFIQPTLNARARWAYRARLRGGIVSGQHGNILLVGDRVRFDGDGRMHVTAAAK
jgi:hypothetical protein